MSVFTETCCIPMTFTSFTPASAWSMVRWVLPSKRTITEPSLNKVTPAQWFDFRLYFSTFKTGFWGSWTPRILLLLSFVPSQNWRRETPDNMFTAPKSLEGQEGAVNILRPRQMFFQKLVIWKLFALFQTVWSPPGGHRQYWAYWRKLVMLLLWRFLK